MLEGKPDIEPGNWQITATTIRCDYVDDFVTIMIESDWTAKCVWYRRYKAAYPKAKLSRDVRSKIPLCKGPECPLVIRYRDKLIKEEKEKTPVQ